MKNEKENSYIGTTMDRSREERKTKQTKQYG